MTATIVSRVNGGIVGDTVMVYMEFGGPDEQYHVYHDCLPHSFPIDSRPETMVAIIVDDVAGGDSQLFLDLPG
jgi:hypothetical protein